MPELRRPCLSDLAHVVSPSDPTISPDGTRVIYTLRTVDTDADKNIDRLWLAGSHSAARELTRGSHDGSPRFSPDGQLLAFLRGEDGARQIWLLSCDGTEPEQLTSLPLGAGVPVWSPDGTRLAFSAPVDLDAQSGESGQRSDAPIVVDSLGSKMDGVGWLRGVRSHVFVLDLGERSVRQVTYGEFHAGVPTWSPDGRYLACADAFAGDADFSGESAAFVVDLQARAAPRRVGPAGGVVADVAWTREGLLLVCSPDTEVSNLRIARVNPVTDELEFLADDLDRNIMPGGPGYPGARPQPAPDGGTVVFCARDRGCTHLYAVAGQARWKLIDGDRVVSGLAVAAETAVAAAIVSTVDSVGEVVLVNLETGVSEPLTEHTANTLGGVEFVTPQERTFTVFDGGVVHGWLLRDRNATGPAPLLVDVHGGPHNAWSPVRDPAHLYHQVLAARGWAVLLLNPRGSDGYGEAFLRGAIGGWGERDENDVLEPVEALVEEGIADARRLALCGYSYGGYLACWLSARTKRFGAVVAGGVVSDLLSMAGTSDVGVRLLATELGTTALDEPDRIARLSPVTHAPAVTSPTLILHGEADQRCPVGQAEQWFAALRTRGVPTELVLYPGASHLFILDGKPSQRGDYNRRIVDWVVRHTRATAKARAASAAVPLEQQHWQRRLRSLVHEHGIVGASLAIHFGDQAVEAACGVLNKRTGAPVTPDSLFQIGSITKVYTTTVALRLVDDGKLELDAPVTDVLPELVLTNPETTKRLSLRHLLTHTSGIDGDVLTDTGRGDDCVRRFVEGLSEVAQIHPIEQTWSYCNTGFVLVGRMIERATGLVWDDAMRELLFHPLGLAATVTLPEEVLRYSPAHGHLLAADGELEPAARWDIPRSSGPAGLIVASAREVLEFARLHLLDGAGGDGTRILSEQLAVRMRSQQVELPAGAGMADSWGLGWFRQDWGGATVIGHNGGTIGQLSFLRLSHEHDLAVSLQTNGGPGQDLHSALCREIFEDLAGIRMPEPDRPPEHPFETDTAALKGVYERAGARFEVFGQGSELAMRMVHTGTLGELGLQPPVVLELVPASPGRFLTRPPGERQWAPVVFYELPDGSPYLHFGGRAAPKASA